MNFWQRFEMIWALTMDDALNKKVLVTMDLLTYLVYKNNSKTLP